MVVRRRMRRRVGVVGEGVGLGVEELEVAVRGCEGDEEAVGKVGVGRRVGVVDPE